MTDLIGATPDPATTLNVWVDLATFGQGPSHRGKHNYVLYFLFFLKRQCGIKYVLKVMVRFGFPF